MASLSRAIKEHKKQPFLKAFVRFGKVWPAARAVRISRDAVYDWLKRDHTFKQDFHDALRLFHNKETAKLSEHMDFFCAVVRPVVPQSVWPAVVTAANLALMQRRFKKDGRPQAVVLSRRPYRFPSPGLPERVALVGMGDGDRIDPLGKNANPGT